MASSELSHYDYHLPRHLIAQNPTPCRSDARLLVVDRAANSLQHKHVRDLPEVLSAGDCLVLNDTRVIPARLLGYRTLTCGKWEGLFLEASPQGLWRVMCRTRGKLRPNETITLLNAVGRDDVQLTLVARQPDGTWIARPASSESAVGLLQRVGRVPLPRYIRGGEQVDSDRTNYQTVYAQVPGSVAAPTAGLHFTLALLDQLAQRGITVCRLTLHVGLATFRPVSTPCLADHRMPSEWGTISRQTVAQIRAARQRGGRVVAVGTTCVRLLETAAADGNLKPFSGDTDLFIRPPYQFRIVNALLTNFHLPRTTLLVLVRTFGGDELIRRAYQEAIRQQYRFYSYGDAMLVL